MTIADAGPLLSAVMNLVGILVEKILASTQMTEEQKKNALTVISGELDKTVEKVRNVKFDALKPPL